MVDQRIIDEAAAHIDEASAAGSNLRRCGADLWQVSEYVERSAVEVPVIYEVDVVVAGAGITGMMAALGAARQGAKTLLVESFSSLGGNTGPGMFAGGSNATRLRNPNAYPDGIGGVPAEFNRRVVGGECRMVGSDYFRDSQAVSCVAARMMEEAGVTILLSSTVTDVIKEGNKVRGVFVENKSGTQAIRSTVVIDCTGTADVADRAGASVIKMPANPGMGVFFAISGADTDKYVEALEDRGKLSEDDWRWLAEHAPGQMNADFMPWARQAWEADEFQLVQTVDDFAVLEVTSPNRKAYGDPPLLRWRTRVNGRFDPGDGLALSRIAQRMWPYLYEFVEFLNKRVPGFENAYLFAVSPYFHSRGGKSIESVRLVTFDDVAKSTRLDDVICIFYGDAKRPDGCDIPYRMLLPVEVDGLLAAGRSAILRGPTLRTRFRVQLMGQAAGVAAALAVKNGVEPRDIDIKQLQKILHSLGCEMGPDARLEELGII